MTAIEFGRGNMKEAERAWRGINVVDQQMYLKDTYLKDKLKWPPRVSKIEASTCIPAGLPHVPSVRLDAC